MITILIVRVISQQVFRCIQQEFHSMELYIIYYYYPYCQGDLSVGVSLYSAGVSRDGALHNLWLLSLLSGWSLSRRFTVFSRCFTVFASKLIGMFFPFDVCMLCRHTMFHHTQVTGSQSLTVQGKYLSMKYWVQLSVWMYLFVYYVCITCSCIFVYVCYPLLEQVYWHVL